MRASFKRSSLPVRPVGGGVLSHAAGGNRHLPQRDGYDDPCSELHSATVVILEVKREPKNENCASFSEYLSR